jgi:hypothetical protein
MRLKFEMIKIWGNKISGHAHVGKDRARGDREHFFVSKERALKIWVKIENEIEEEYALEG